MFAKKWVGRSLTRPVRCVGLIVHGREKLSREGLRKMRREGANEAILARSTDHVALFLVPSQSQNTCNLGPVTLLLLRQQGKKTCSPPAHQPRAAPSANPSHTYLKGPCIFKGSFASSHHGRGRTLAGGQKEKSLLDCSSRLFL